MGKNDAVLVPDLLSRQNKANRDTAILTLQSVKQALKMYLIDHQGRWPDIKSRIDVLIEAPPNDPQGLGANVVFEESCSGDDFGLNCAGL